MLDLRRVEPDPAWEAELLDRVRSAVWAARERADIECDVEAVPELLELDCTIAKAQLLQAMGEW